MLYNPIAGRPGSALFDCPRGRAYMEAVADELHVERAHDEFIFSSREQYEEFVARMGEVKE